MVSAPLAVNESTARLLETGKRCERIFYSGMAITMALVCFAGFAPSYFLRTHLGPPQPLPLLLHVHGLAFTLWIALLVTQSSLIAATKTDLHRRLGIAGGILAVAMVVLGVAVAITRAKQGLLAKGSGIPPLVFLAIPLISMIVFPAFIAAALYFRRRVDIHKRLILLGTLEILAAAVGRFPEIATASPFVLFAVTDLLLIPMIVYDYMSRGRLHPATKWGGLFLMVSQFGRVLLAPTAVWLSIAQWITT